MKVLKYFLIFLLVAIIVTPILLLVFGLEDEPIVTQGRQLAVEDMVRAKKFWNENDPRELKPGEIKTVFITQNDMNLALNYASTQFMENRFNARVDLYPEKALALVSIQLPRNMWGRYINLLLTFMPEDSLLELTRVKVGAIPLPAWLVRPINRQVNIEFKDYPQVQTLMKALKAIRQIKLEQESLYLTYEWQPEYLERLREEGRNFMFSQNEQSLLRIYQQEIIKIADEQRGRKKSLTNLLRPLFRFAEQRTRSGQNAIEENRALIISLTVYCLGRDVNQIIGGQNDLPKEQHKRVNPTLLDRNDLALHFMVSAAITAAGGSGLASIVGVFKEVEDSKGGSGFSFADLAADHAGVRLGELAIRSQSSASRLQDALRKLQDEHDYMPHVDNLPEGIQELEFKQTYESLDSQAYKMVDDEINRRILDCRVYQK